MTPFQRQVIDAARAKEYEAQQQQQEQIQQQSTGSGPTRNARSGSGSRPAGGNSETVRYVNREVYPDHDVHD